MLLRVLLFTFLPNAIYSQPKVPPAPAASVRLVHQFPKPTWLENLAVRANGFILTTDLLTPHIHQLNPFAPSTQAPQLIASFTDALGALGITETEPDVFAVIAGNFSLFEAPIGSVAGSYSIWQVDLRGQHAEAQVSKITDIPQASFANGLTYLPPPANALLIAESTDGVVLRLDLTTNQVTTAVDSPLMKRCNPKALVGVNGVKVLPNQNPSGGGTLYFTNSACSTLARISIFPNGSAAGLPGQIIANTTQAPLPYEPDDFILDPHTATAYLAGGTENVVGSISQIFSAGGGHGGAPAIMQSILAGNLNSSALAGPTAVAFGRTPMDRDVLYVSTNGDIPGPVNGTTVVGGQVVAVRLNRR